MLFCGECYENLYLEAYKLSIVQGVQVFKVLNDG
jgi:hypothetical protein